MLRYKLRTLLILLAVLPPLLAGAWFAIPEVYSHLPVAVALLPLGAFLLTFAAFFAMYVSQ